MSLGWSQEQTTSVRDGQTEIQFIDDLAKDLPATSQGKTI